MDEEVGANAKGEVDEESTVDAEVTVDEEVTVDGNLGTEEDGADAGSVVDIEVAPEEESASGDRPDAVGGDIVRGDWLGGMGGDVQTDEDAAAGRGNSTDEESAGVE